MNTQDPPPPPPPPPPGGQFTDPFADNPEAPPPPDEPLGQGLEGSKPEVSSAPSRVFIIFGLALAVFTYMVFDLFVIPDSDPDPVNNDEIDIARPDNIPDIPDLSAEITPPPPPTFIPPEIPTSQPPVIQPQNDGPNNELRRQRLRSSMLIGGGGGGSILPDLNLGGDSSTTSDVNLQFANGVYASNTRAKKQKATHLGNLRTTVAQGKIINAVLETAINTDLPGSLRAIVSRDIFPEAGDFKIIPKGSRLIGRYNASLFGGQKRVYVVWTRLIRPDGVDIMINSPLIDQIGQAGVAGQVDTKFTEIFSRALLTSAVTIAVAAAADEINGGESTTTTTNTDGSTTTTSDATTEAIIQSTSRLGGVAEGYLRRYINIQPTILVDQGTTVNVFVNRDLIFPSEFAGMRILP
ncbi:MAG: hypothetical protein MRY32_05205 [Rickettsiales bacterium]|nr:hypothetical protein [Rickettsiales bacterium]